MTKFSTILIAALFVGGVYGGNEGVRGEIAVSQFKALDPKAQCLAHKGKVAHLTSLNSKLAPAAKLFWQIRDIFIKNRYVSCHSDDSGANTDMNLAHEFLRSGKPNWTSSNGYLRWLANEGLPDQLRVNLTAASRYWRIRRIIDNNEEASLRPGSDLSATEALRDELGRLRQRIKETKADAKDCEQIRNIVFEFEPELDSTSNSSNDDLEDQVDVSSMDMARLKGWHRRLEERVSANEHLAKIYQQIRDAIAEEEQGKFYRQIQLLEPKDEEKLLAAISDELALPKTIELR